MCCGNGIIAEHLAGLGYLITGVDASEQMLRYAQEHSPGSSFILADARDLELTPAFEAAISTFDSLNHMLSVEDLVRVLKNVHGALLDGGSFVFDINLEQSYRTAWNSSCSIIDAERACFIRGGYDPDTRLGRTEITLFEQNGSWHRSDVTFLQRFHPVEDIKRLLSAAGFRSAVPYNPGEDLGVEGPFSEGRAVFVAVK